MKIITSHVYALAGTIILSLPFNIAAQDSSLEEVRVTADPLSTRDDHMLQPGQVLDKKALARKSIQNLGETVSRELGVSSSDFGAGVGRPVIRGLGGGRVKVMESGISTMDASTTSGDHAVTTEPVFAEQIEILRGPATLLYGSGASGGLVNVVQDRIPHQALDGVEAEAVLQYESVNNGKTGAAKLKAGNGSLVLHLGGMNRNSDNYDIPGFASIEPDADELPGTLENSATETTSLEAGFSWFGNAGVLGFAVSSIDSDYGIPGHHHHEEEDHEEGEEHAEDDEDHAGEEEGGVTVDLNQVRYDINGVLYAPVSGIREIRTRWGINDYGHDEVEPSGEIGTSFINDEVEGRIEVLHENITRWEGAIGLQYNNRDFSATGEEAFVLPSELDSIALFVIEKADFGAWHVDLGLRYEDQSAATDTGLSADHKLISIGGGVTVDYAPGYEAGISIGRYQRGPGLEELFSYGPHAATNAFEVGNTGLVDETSVNLDLHWHKTTGLFTFKANLFYNAIDNFIYLAEQDLNADGVADRVEPDFSGDPAEILPPGDAAEPLLLFHTQANARLSGFELEGVLHLINTRQQKTNLRLWTDYVDGELANNVNLPRITPWRVGANLDWQSGPWELGLAWTRMSRQDNTAVLETATPGYHMLDLYTSYNLDYNEVAVSLFARGTNLLDKEARRHISLVKDRAPLPGRSAIIGIRINY